MDIANSCEDKNEKYIAWLDNANFISSSFIREFVSEQWDERKLTNDELVEIMETMITEDYADFLYEHIAAVIGHNCPTENIVSKSG